MYKHLRLTVAECVNRKLIEDDVILSQNFQVLSGVLQSQDSLELVDDK